MSQMTRTLTQISGSTVRFLMKTTLLKIDFRVVERGNLKGHRGGGGLNLAVKKAKPNNAGSSSHKRKGSEAKLTAQEARKIKTAYAVNTEPRDLKKTAIKIHQTRRLQGRPRKVLNASLGKQKKKYDTGRMG